MSSAASQAPCTYHSAHRFSARGIAGIVAAHAAVLALLATLNVVPLPPPLATLMVQIIAPTPPAPAISPPHPTPVESKPVIRPKPAPVTPTPRQPMLAAPAETAQATAEVPIVRETPAPAPAPSAAATAAVSQPRFDADYLLNPAPVYPALSRKLGEEGKVVLRVFVETTGRPSQIEIKTSSAWPRLDLAAQEAVWRWKFIPARRGEEATGAWVLVPIVFNLRS